MRLRMKSVSLKPEVVVFRIVWHGRCLIQKSAFSCFWKTEHAANSRACISPLPTNFLVVEIHLKVLHGAPPWAPFRTKASSEPPSFWDSSFQVTNASQWVLLWGLSSVERPALSKIMALPSWLMWGNVGWKAHALCCKVGQPWRAVQLQCVF